MNYETQNIAMWLDNTEYAYLAMVRKTERYAQPRYGGVERFAVSIKLWCESNDFWGDLPYKRDRRRIDWTQIAQAYLDEYALQETNQ